MERRKKYSEIYDEDQLEIDILKRKSVSYIIVGKPGSGKSTLARHLAKVWNCVLINDTVLLEEAIRLKSDLGTKAKEVLLNGGEISPDFMVQIICENLHSSEVHHHGYVLDCLPTGCEKWKNISEQIEFIRSIDIRPTIVINLKISDQELEQRRIMQKVDPVKNNKYLCSVDYKAPPTNEKEIDGGDTEDDYSDENEESENEKSEIDMFEADVEFLNDQDLFSEDSNFQLVRRPQDVPGSIEEEIQFFKKSVLKPLEDFIIDHNRQFVIELDANLLPKELLKSLLIHLDSLGLSRCPVPQPLFDPEEDDDDTDGLDNEQFLQQLTDTKTLLPKFRWRRSKWGRYCPVELARGNLTLGQKEFSTGFLDKMYCMSSAEALKEFTNNPRPYLLPPLPCIPCKVCVLGPPTSGKSTLAKMLSQHYDAMVLNMEQLLIPVITKEKTKLIEAARQEAIDSIMQAGEDTVAMMVNADHPDVVKAVECANVTINSSSISVTQEMYMEALRSGIDLAEQKKREKDPNGPRYGGWIVDSFPLTRENWTAMIENNLLPDFVISLEDENLPKNFLLTRFTEMHNLPPPAQKDDKEDEGSIKVSELVNLWQNATSDYDRHWGQLSAAIKGSAIDPLVIDCSLQVNEVLSTAITLLDEVFSVKPLEYSFQDDDADADDDPDLTSGTGDEKDEESNEQLQHHKSWGDTLHFCPVALQENYVLWPGNNDIAVKYKEKLYCFSSEEAKEKFCANPILYTAVSKPIQIPPLRIFLLGPKSAGKTSIGRYLAANLGVFHISFRDFLQEQILPKLKKPSLIHDDEWEDDDEDSEHEGIGTDGDDLELDPDIRIPLSDEEAEIQSFLLNGENLSDETLQKYIEPFWSSEPYKSTGFILEGFPSSPDEMRFFAERGWYPDAAIILQVKENDVIKRLFPSRFAVWIRKRNKKMIKRMKLKKKLMEEWKADKEQRKAELKADYDAKFAANSSRVSSDEEDEIEEPDVDKDEYLQQLADINEEEPPEMEEDEDEEVESEAKERIKNTIIDLFEEQIESILSLQECIAELQIPCHSVNASRKIHVVKFSVDKVLLPFTREREGLLTKCTPVNAIIAKKLLDHGYKYLSNFKKWCPIKLLETSCNVLPPIAKYKSQQFPVIYRQHIYFPSSASFRSLFIANPHKYLSQQPPGPAIPVTLCIVGPPKSGKTTVAMRFSSEYGCVRLSIGEVLRRTLTKFPHSKLSKLIYSHLKAGQIVPDDLCILALESTLLDVQCCTRGFVLDGWPSTKSQVDLLNKFHITPVCILELVVNDSEILRRGEKDRCSIDRVHPFHDSSSILLIRSKYYNTSIEPVKKWYSQEHDNWYEINGLHSEWWTWKRCKDHALFCAQQIQHYILRTSLGQAASIYGLCVTPSNFKKALGEFYEYCPVSLALQEELIDCSGTKSLKYAAEYRGRYYKMNSRENLELFLSNPDSFISPRCPHPLPSLSLLPKRKSHFDIKSLFPKQFEMNGFCPVCYVDGNKCYESLIAGNPEYSVEYCEWLYCLCTEFHAENFMRRPSFYKVSSLPSKVPPIKQISTIVTLPMLGYLEQGVATALIDSLGAVGTAKPKFPFLSSTQSALYYVGMHLKAFNPNSKEYTRQKYKKKLSCFNEKCRLTDYLIVTMKSGYKEPIQQHINFRQKMDSFIDLKNSRLTV